ncbi:UDP-N-acetylmuramate dehydrogenase [Pseudodesulfovibrio sp.]|uniref:UDP-N-acetylmuramate dehydrogenase n=1 Tax=unclassified Pseudodesulfovibrio TaxID=2661612 RepID=UPI003B005C20
MALELIRNPSLSERTTLGLGGTAEVELVVREKGDLDAVAQFLSHENLRPFVIGRGSNLLVRDSHLDLALIRPDMPSGPTRVERNGDGLVVRCGAGQRLPGLLGWAQRAGFSGLENLTGIPGTVGGAVAMNAGSYGTSFGDLITRVRLWSPAQGLVWVDADQCHFGYRHFSCPAHPGKSLVWEVELLLAETSADEVRNAMRSVYKKKQGTQPVTAASAGCIFKNPEGESAGRLLDKAGFKGMRLGHMAFSDMHANFLINLGGGTSAQALDLMEAAKSAVSEKFGITLEPEVILL